MHFCAFAIVSFEAGVVLAISGLGAVERAFVGDNESNLEASVHLLPSFRWGVRHFLPPVAPRLSDCDELTALVHLHRFVVPIYVMP